MAIVWSDSLATGVAWQDRQHKELFRRVNSLLEAMNVGLGKEEVLRLFAFLDDYFVVHFEAEEQAMNRYKYPGLIAHLSEHMGLIERVSALREECASGVTPASLIKVQRMVVDWLINHIGGADKALGSFLVEAERNERLSGRKA